MWGWYEVTGESMSSHERGSIRLNTFYETRKKPLWQIGLKLLGLVALLAVGFVLLLPYVPLPLWQSTTVVSGVLLIYVGIAFFVRPEPSENNMGYLGGMMDDPTQYSDDINRRLWSLHCLLGPGRFVAETILDLCTHLGLTAEVTAEQANQEESEKRQAAIQQAILQDHPDVAARLEQRRAAAPGGQMELSSASYLDPDRFDV